MVSYQRSWGYFSGPVTMSGTMNRHLIFVLIMLAACGGLAGAKVDPSTGLIRVISIGECFHPETRLPFFLRADPRIRYQPVPTNWYEGTFSAVGSDRKDAERFMRLYFPRSYERFLESYDVTLLSDFEVDIISPTQFEWMADAVEVGGMGIGKYEMNYDPAHWQTFDLFRASALYPVFPTSLAHGREFSGIGLRATTMPDTGENHPILDLPNMPGNRLPVDIGSGKAGYENPRQGSTVIARYVPNREPAMVIWQYEEGQAMSCVPGHDTIDWALSEHWPFTVDFWINQVWYLADLEISLDIEILHQLRENSMSYAIQRELATSVIDFAERFGSPTARLYQKLSEADETKEESDRLYRENDYQESMEMVELAFEQLREVADESVKAKDAALFWIYAVEWVVVTAAAIISGSVLWSLMVRRRLYSEIAVTRSQH